MSFESEEDSKAENRINAQKNTNMFTKQKTDPLNQNKSPYISSSGSEYDEEESSSYV